SQSRQSCGLSTSFPWESSPCHRKLTRAAERSLVATQDSSIVPAAHNLAALKPNHSAAPADNPTGPMARNSAAAPDSLHCSQKNYRNQISAPRHRPPSNAARSSRHENSVVPLIRQETSL